MITNEFCLKGILIGGPSVLWTFRCKTANLFRTKDPYHSTWNSNLYKTFNAKKYYGL